MIDINKKEINSIALIPARAGSKRIPNKNILRLAGHPMLAYTIRSAVDSSVFDAIVCVTDSEEYARIARYYGAEVPLVRPMEISGDTSPDIEWASWIINYLDSIGRQYDVFSILRPTSPFRLPETIQRAWRTFIGEVGVDSLRAVEKCNQHPGKMWILRSNRLLPVLPFTNDSTPWHSCQYAALPEVYVQNASLEMAWTRLVKEENTISGENIVPFLTQGYEGFDINIQEDFELARLNLSNGKAKLHDIGISSYFD